jgi:hypothetical protein
MRAVLDLIPWNRIRPITRNIKTVYAHYRNGRSFNAFQVTGNLDFEFPNLDIYSLNFDSTLIWPYCPFYYEVAVDGDTFKGFMGKSYHSRRIARVSNEYQISVYRDYIYTGIFFDYTAFEGSDMTLREHSRGSPSASGATSLSSTSLRSTCISEGTAFSLQEKSSTTYT